MAFSIDTVINKIINEDIQPILKISMQKNKYPCSICDKSVRNNQKAILCDTCKLWTHIKCDGTSNNDYENMIENQDDTLWHWLVCRVRLSCSLFPFTLSDIVELQNLQNSDSMRMLESLPTFDISEVSKFANLSSNDIDLNISNSVNCKYYSVENFYKLQVKESKSDNFNIFHSNVNGLDTHFEILHQFLSGSPKDFDVINLTETSQQENENFKTNVSMEGYDPFFTPSNSIKGGTGIYVKSVYDTIERTDLKIKDDDFESTWIEIKNNKSKILFVAAYIGTLVIIWIIFRNI